MAQIGACACFHVTDFNQPSEPYRRVHTSGMRMIVHSMRLTGGYTTHACMYDSLLLICLSTS